MEEQQQTRADLGMNALRAYRLAGQEHGRTPHRNKRDWTRNTGVESAGSREAAAGSAKDTGGNETQVETQVETIRAWLGTIRTETDEHREERAGKQETLSK
ncbi:hypothetical protein EYF80_026404 [Liparis tanakae]|uniref:Uncharacterized protein n=1 Tax=Liparis tanakae TaxID=230148 RepID=A0A4Z2HF23_9TELE|nr:hypothetical protein EYF80_026404 [Liparis tanakae]